MMSYLTPLFLTRYVIFKREFSIGKRLHKLAKNIYIYNISNTTAKVKVFLVIIAKIVKYGNFSSYFRSFY